jgi:hypothetical protein
MIKVSHEMPLCLLEDGTERKINSYFYALVHLFDTHPKYYQYTVEQLKSGREVILDNSAYELHGKPFDTQNFVKWINQLSEDSHGATEFYLTYIIPDEFDKMERTFWTAVNFLGEYKDLPGHAMAVCQGNTIEELASIFKKYLGLPGLTRIGINFMSKAYLNFFENAFGYVPPDPWLARSQGRKFFLEYLYHTGALEGKIIHLLGCAVPGEFRYYTFEHPKLAEFIYSLDTSAPIIQGMFSGTPYDLHCELSQTKMEQKLADHLDTQLSEPQRLRIQHNAELFRIYNGL